MRCDVDASKLHVQSDVKQAVVLIGFQKTGNLGLGYLSAVLRQAGFAVHVIDIEAEPTEIRDTIAAVSPVLVGFSLIFQYYIRRYGAMMAGLRRDGINCHFTMGGHYPTLNFVQTLATIPELDSIVRFEGEATLLELAQALQARQEWRHIQGLVYRNADRAIANPPRALAPDLDALPFPDRDFEPVLILGRKAMPILASRGCVRTCSFCSIHTFYRTAPGKVVRIRKPAEIVREMRMLHEQRGINIFLFQDDDFPLFGPKWRAWADSFVDELHTSGLSQKIIWKINCRADAVEAALLSRMREAGLYTIYMGLESGTEEGLVTLPMQISVEENVQAVRTLKQIGIRFEFGFMLLDPSSTFDSVHQNIEFLREIVGDGCAPAGFCKMLPYDGTPIKDALAASGRLRGDVCAPDYNFLDPRLDAFYEALARIVDVTGWIHGPRALTLTLEWAFTEVAAMRRLFPHVPDLDGYEASLREQTRRTNQELFDVVEALVEVHRTGRGHAPDARTLKARCEETLERVTAARNSFIARHQPVLLRALAAAA